MQHEIFRNPSKRGRSSYPFVVVLQADVAEGETRIVAPLALRANFPNNLPRGLPAVVHDGETYVTMLTLLGSVPVSLLRHAAGSISEHRDDITRALDWLLWGI